MSLNVNWFGMSNLLDFFSIFRCRTLIGLSVIIGSVLCSSSCHKEDPNAYRLSVNEFIISVNHEMQFQKAILAEFKKYPYALKNLNVLSDREITANKSLQKLRIFAEQYQILLSDSLDDNYNRQLQQIAGSDNGLIRLATLSDQEMIRLHIRASSNTGVNDAALRSWAESQVAIFRRSLDNLQELK